MIIYQNPTLFSIFFLFPSTHGGGHRPSVPGPATWFFCELELTPMEAKPHNANLSVSASSNWCSQPRYQSDVDPCSSIARELLAVSIVAVVGLAPPVAIVNGDLGLMV